MREEQDTKMDVGKRDKMMNELASEAASEFVHKYEIGDKQVKSSPETVLQYSIPYLTVRTLQRQEKALDRQEKALKSLEADSRWIKAFAIITAILTAALLVPDRHFSALRWTLGCDNKPAVNQRIASLNTISVGDAALHNIDTSDSDTARHNTYAVIQSSHVYEVRPGKDKRGFDLISDVLPF